MNKIQAQQVQEHKFSNTKNMEILVRKKKNILQ